MRHGCTEVCDICIYNGQLELPQTMCEYTLRTEDLSTAEQHGDHVAGCIYERLGELGLNSGSGMHSYSGIGNKRSQQYPYHAGRGFPWLQTEICIGRQKRSHDALVQAVR